MLRQNISISFSDTLPKSLSDLAVAWGAGALDIGVGVGVGVGGTELGGSGRLGVVKSGALEIAFGTGEANARGVAVLVLVLHIGVGSAFVLPNRCIGLACQSVGAVAWLAVPSTCMSFSSNSSPSSAAPSPERFAQTTATRIFFSELDLK
jgi:hypothetical protein